MLACEVSWVCLSGFYFFLDEFRPTNPTRRFISAMFAELRKFLSLVSLLRDSSGGECTHHPAFVSATGLHYGVQALERAEPAE